MEGTHHLTPRSAILTTTSSLPPLHRSVDQAKTLSEYPGSARQFLGIDEATAVVAAARDPCAYEYIGPLRQATDDWAYAATFAGAKTVSPQEYIAAAIALEPDVVITLSDDVPCDVKRTRIATSVDRSSQWLSACLAALPGATTSGAPPAVFAGVQGGQIPEERQRSAQSLSPHLPLLTGVCIGGLGTGESIALRAELVQAVLSNTPAEKLRMLPGLGTPEEILAAIAQGIDLFDMSYIADVTDGGYALTFPLTPEDESKERSSPASFAMDDFTHGEMAATAGSDDTKINLWAEAYRTDRRPLVDGCTCLACAAHTRGYIHHLLESHEMTAQVLLEAHNTAHMLKFFRAVRGAIAGGRFGEYVEWVQGRKRQWQMDGGAA